LDKNLAKERASNPTAVLRAEEKMKDKWGAGEDATWSDIISATSAVTVLDDSAEALLVGVASFMGALVLWWLLRRSARRRLEHRLIMTKAGCVDLLINLMASDQLRAPAPAATAGPMHPDPGPAAKKARIKLPEQVGEDGSDEPDENREAGVAEYSDAVVEEVDAAVEAHDNTDDTTGEVEEVSAPAIAAPRLDADDGEGGGGGSVSQLAAATLAMIAATSDAASQGPGLHKDESVQRILSHMFLPGCDDTTSESLTQTLQELLAGRQPRAVLLAVVKALSNPVHAVLLPARNWRAANEATGGSLRAQKMRSGADSMRLGGECELERSRHEQNLQQLRMLLSIFPKQCSSRIRQAVSHTGLVGSLLQLVWSSHERPLLLRPIPHNVTGGTASVNNSTHCALKTDTVVYALSKLKGSRRHTKQEREEDGAAAGGEEAAAAPGVEPDAAGFVSLSVCLSPFLLLSFF